MSPVRLLIIAALLYIGYRLIFGRKKGGSGKDGDADRINGPVEDVLVEDPVCHALVPKRQAIHLNHQGRMVHFCSEECCRKFIDNNGPGEQS